MSNDNSTHAALTCNNCGSVSTTSLLMDYYYSWCSSITCVVCGSNWLVCFECRSLARRKWEFDSTSSKGTSAINKHHTRYHSQSVVQQTTAIDDSDKTTKYDDISENQQNDTYIFSSNNETVQSKFSDGIMQSSNKKISLNDLSHMFGNMASANFFDAEINNGVTAGYQQLVMRSQLGAVSTSIEVPVVDIQRQLLLSHFIMGLKKQQKNQFPSIVTMIKDIAEDAIREMLSGTSVGGIKFTKLPTSPALLRSMYTEGRNAILTNIPRPMVQSYDVSMNNNIMLLK